MKPAICMIITSLFLAFPALAQNGMVNVASSFGVKESGDRLENILAKKGMTIFKRVDHGAGAQKVGIDLRETELVIFGNPKVGSPLMKCQQSVAIDLPQKALIWKDDDGLVWISYNDPHYLQERHDIKGCEQVINKISNALAGITKAAAGK